MPDYPSLISPVVPDAQHNKSPELLIEGFTKGMAAFAQFAQIRRQQESDLAHMALQERLAGEQHALEQQKLSQAAELIPSQIAANQAHADLYTAQGKMEMTGSRTVAQIAAEKARKNELLLEEVGKDVLDLQLEDVDLQTKNPVRFGMNAEAFAKKYQWSTVPAIRAARKQYLSIADEQTVMLKHGMVDEEGKLNPSGQGQRVPLRKVALMATNPATSAQTLRDLEASGQTEVIGSIMEMFKEGGKAYTDNLKAVKDSNTPVDYGVSTAAPALTPGQQQAVDWAHANPQDARSAAILKKLGVQ